MYRSRCGLCARSLGAQRSVNAMQIAATKRNGRRSARSSTHGYLEPVRHAERDVRDVCTARRLRRGPVAVNRRRAILQQGGEDIEERLLVEIVGNAAAVEVALQSGGAAVSDRQLAGAFAAADPLDRGAPRAAPARLKADSPVRMLIAHELGTCGLAAFFVFQPGDIAGDAVVSELVRSAEAHPGVLRMGIGSGSAANKIRHT